MDETTRIALPWMEFLVHGIKLRQPLPVLHLTLLALHPEPQT